MFMLMLRLARVLVAVSGAGVNIEFDALNLAAFGPMGVQVVAAQGEFGQFVLQLAKLHAQIQHGPQKHVAADAAENIEIKSFQSFDLRADEASSLIWLAA